MDSTPVRVIISNSEYEEITSFNRKYFSASNDEEMKRLEEESATIETKIEDFVLNNADKFNSKELVIDKDKETGLLHILSSKNK